MAEENNWVNWALAAGGALLGAIALLATGAKPTTGQRSGHEHEYFTKSKSKSSSNSWLWMR